MFFCSNQSQEYTYFTALHKAKNRKTHKITTFKSENNFTEMKVKYSNG